MIAAQAQWIRAVAESSTVGPAVPGQYYNKLGHHAGIFLLHSKIFSPDGYITNADKKERLEQAISGDFFSILGQLSVCLLECFLVEYSVAWKSAFGPSKFR